MIWEQKSEVCTITWKEIRRKTRNWADWHRCGTGPRNNGTAGAELMAQVRHRLRFIWHKSNATRNWIRHSKTEQNQKSFNCFGPNVHYRTFVEANGPKDKISFLPGSYEPRDLLI